MFIAVNVEGFTRPFSIGRVTDARDPTAVWVQWYAPQGSADPITAAWSATANQQVVARAAVRMTFALQRGGRLAAAVQDDLRSISDDAAAVEAAGGAASAGSGSGSGSGAAGSSSGGGASSSSLADSGSGGAGAGSGSGAGSEAAAASRRTTRSSAKTRRGG
jgi:hypothetical protein